MTKQNIEKEVVTKCKVHHYVVTGWNTKGIYKHANQMRCAHCLVPVSLEELESKEWIESQGL